jgi:hypothetical protein
MAIIAQLFIRSLLLRFVFRFFSKKIMARMSRHPRMLTLLGALPFLIFFRSEKAFACATCGLSSSFTPKMFFISLGFVILPAAFVGFIAWRLWLDQKRQSRSLENKESPSS